MPYTPLGGSGFLFAEGGIDMYFKAYRESGEAAYHHPPEKIDESLRTVSAENIVLCEKVMKPTCEHTRNHHTQSHEGCAESVM